MPEVTHERTDQPDEYLIRVDGEPVGKLTAGRSYGDGEVRMRWYHFTPSQAGYRDWSFGSGNEAGALGIVSACVCFDATRGQDKE